MVASAPVSHHHSDNDMASSPDAGTRGFIAVNHASSNESDSSSRLSSPQDNPRRGSEFSSQTQASTYQQPQNQDVGKHKRKRSRSIEQGPYSDERRYEDSPSRRPEPQHMANRALHVLGGTDHGAAGYYQNGVDQNGHTWQPERSLQQHNTINGVRPGTSEAQLVEVLQRETNAQDAQPRPWDLASSANGQVSHDQYGRETSAGITSVGPKRKRNFSNRTKTGCLTCRQRKKKCDETHPICNNCTRGGFTCKGYNVSRRIWPAKPTPAKAPVPLQSKDGQSDVSEPSSSYQGPGVDSPSSNRPPVQFEGGQSRPIPIEDHEIQRQQQYVTTPPQTEPRGRPSYPGQQPWPPQQIQTYTSDPLPPLSDLNRSEPPSSAHSRDMSRPPTQGTPHPQQPPPSHQAPPQAQSHLSAQTAAPSQPGLPNISHHPSAPPAQQPAPWAPPPQQTDYRHAYGPPPTDHQTPPSHMRMTSSGFDHHKSGTKTFTKEDVERSKMLRHTHYNHFDPTLQYERQRCERALERYNAACKLDSGVSEEETRNILIKVFDPSKDTTHKFPSHTHEKGHLGHGVKIEAPFNCTYGYNIKLLDNVYVGKDCTIDDAGYVEVGPRTIIGPGVTILTTDYGKDLAHRKGTGGAWIANPVFIASEVVIGAKAVIYPGVKIERGCTVEPLAVVRESLGEFQTQRATTGERVREMV